MNIINQKDIKKIITEKSKFQKVMLLYDNTVSNIGITNIYQEIREICVFNKVDLASTQDVANIVNDGYRMLIYFCSTDSFLNLSIDRQDFINIYIPTDNGILPFFLNSSSELTSSNDYLILNSGVADTCAITSVYFNKFFNYLRNLLNMKSNDFEFKFLDEITQLKVLENIEMIESNEMLFCDIDILRSCHIPYELLPLVDFILISAFSTIVSAVRSHNLSMVDVYKSAGEDYALVDKFYAMYNNESLSGLINLNFYFLNTVIDKSKEKILEILSYSYQFDKKQVDDVIKKIKSYAKLDTGILGYLYLYNIFSV